MVNSLDITSHNYQESYMHLLLQYGVLKFGDFVTKSGRKTPYFINTGSFDSGLAIDQVAQCYAHHILRQSSPKSRGFHLYGPAYKGIPLSVAIAMRLSSLSKSDVKFTFNRKEAKTHGEKGSFVGASFDYEKPVYIVEDVMTGATSIRETFEMFDAWNQSTSTPPNQRVKVGGVFLGVDRQEVGPSGKTSARNYVETTYNVPVYPIVSISQILTLLGESSQLRQQYHINFESIQTVSDYLKEYGA